MNSTLTNEPRVEPGSAPGKCSVCGRPVEDRCFCKIYRPQSGPVLLCRPSCTIRYIDSTRPPGDAREQELRAYEQSVHFLIEQNSPLS